MYSFKRLTAPLALTVCVLIAAITILAHADSTGELTYTEPYLLSLYPEREMNICWLTKADGSATVEFGETRMFGRSASAKQYKVEGLRTSAAMDGYDPDPEKNPKLMVYQQIATLSGLKPNTTYYYRVTTRSGSKTQSGKMYHFTTSPVNGENFRFALLSDLQLKVESPETVKLIGQQKPSFILYGGDLQNTPWKAGEWFALDNCYIADEEKGKSWFEIMQQEAGGSQLLQYIPIYPAPGNHEVDDQRIFVDKEMAADDKENWFFSIYMQIFRPLYPSQEYGSGGKHWYSLDYGDMHISSISALRYQAWDGFEAPGWLMFDDISADSPQVNWLEKDLMESSAPYKWVVMHWHMLNRGNDGHIPYSKPVIEGGKITYPDGDLAYTVLKPLYEKAGVSGVNYGHSHVYERYLINGVNYIEAASIGNNYRDKDDPLHPSGIEPVIERNDIRSYMILEKTEHGLVASGYAASGETKGQVFDRFIIPPQ